VSVRDLAPEIHRQRLVVEGLCPQPIDARSIREYLSQLSKAIDMVELMEPVTHQSPLYGWAGWIHWETSGAHFYAWDEPRLFFSVDVYACKPFSAEAVVELTREWFDASEVVCKEF
jgi:S-adenosylmethionine decarboxylase